ncbi:tripartite tricarboxylate transporter TctB family protein [Variovorax sp. VNK109]|uniref:tripartite tricarboxylate transporter TctB family protein n=1 Tax=Variovorax sp. VNK109 TaxID=3400919 RepID=UPI003C100F52
MSEGGKTARSDIIGGAGWIVFGALVLVESLRMDRFTQMGATLYTMPGFMPGLIGCVLMLLGVILIMRGLGRRKSEAAQAGDAIPPAALINRRTAYTLALCLVYACLLIGRVHFIGATAVFVAAFVWLFTPEGVTPRKRIIAAVMAGLATAVTVDLVFEDVFLVRLP